MKSPAVAQRPPARHWAIALLALFLLTLLASGPGMAASTERKVTSGKLTWGVRESFRSYLTGPIANGKMEAKDKATLDSKKVITFPEGKGTFKDGKATVKYVGKVHFYGHDGELDFTFSDPELKIGGGKGQLTVTYQAGKNPSKRIALADVDATTLGVSGTSVTASKINTKLTKAGVECFSYKGHGFYKEGEALDPVSTSLTLDSAAPTTKPSTPKPSPSSPAPSKPSPSRPAPSKTAPSKPSPGKPAPGPVSASAGSLTWGLKSSFRSYIAGPIAHGRITVSGHAAARGSGFSFPQTSTTAKPPSSTGTTSYAGSVNFYGHDGVLNLTFSNPRVVIPSAGNGQLVFDYAINGQNKGKVTLASLNLGAGKRTQSGNTVSYQGVPATLTNDGTKPFEWEGRKMYPAGTVLDPVSFSIGSAAKVSGSTSSSDVTGKVSSPSTSGSSATDGTGPAPAPAGTSSASSAASGSTGAGSLIWGVRASFRSYILGPIANGSITVGGGASSSGSAWLFPQSGGRASDGGASYRGSVKFYGHKGILNLTFANPTVRITSASSAVLSVSVNGSRKDMVNLDLSHASKSERNGTTVYTGAPAKLTSAGSGVFSYQGNAFYQPGEAMDPVTFTVGSPSSASGSSSTTSAGDPGTPTSADGAETPGGSSSSSDDGSSDGSSSAPTTSCSAKGEDLRWGFKESFRSYINGSIANGSWTPSGGAQYKTPTFIWPSGSGSFSKDGKQGTVRFPGSVHFTGHEGALDTTVSNPTIELTGDKAYLKLDAKSTLMDAAMEGRTEWVTKKATRFVELDMSKISISKHGGQSTITGSSVPTKLTTSGSQAFPNYTAGTAMDPLSFRITASSNCVSQTKSGSTPSSTAKHAGKHGKDVDSTKTAGMSDNGVWPWLGGGAIGVLGASAVAAAYSRGRKSGMANANVEELFQEGDE